MENGEKLIHTISPRVTDPSIPAGGPGHDGLRHTGATDGVAVHHDGESVVATNYYESKLAKMGFAVLTYYQSTFHLLLPRFAMKHLPDMSGSEYVIVTRNRAEELWTLRVDGVDEALRLSERQPGVELLFEDHSVGPCLVHLDERMTHGLPGKRAVGRTDFRFVAYSDGLKVELERPARYRHAPYLPWTRRWGGG